MSKVCKESKALVEALVAIFRGLLKQAWALATACVCGCFVVPGLIAFAFAFHRFHRFAIHRFAFAFAFAFHRFHRFQRFAFAFHRFHRLHRFHKEKLGWRVMSEPSLSQNKPTKKT